MRATRAHHARAPRACASRACVHACVRAVHARTRAHTPRTRRSAAHRLRLLSLAPQRYKGRVYFALELTDDDGVGRGAGGVRPTAGTGTGTGTGRDAAHDDGPFFVRLSHEHTAWTFERDGEAAANAVHAHSGGYNSMAIRETLQP